MIHFSTLSIANLDRHRAEWLKDNANLPSKLLQKEVDSFYLIFKYLNLLSNLQEVESNPVIVASFRNIVAWPGFIFQDSWQRRAITSIDFAGGCHSLAFRN
jgi:hypothetical protein